MRISIVLSVWLLFGLGFVFNIEVYSQKVTFRLYSENRCNNTYEELCFWSLHSCGKAYDPVTNIIESCDSLSDDYKVYCFVELPDTGRYVISGYWLDREYHFKEYKLYSDTINIATVEHLISTTSPITFSGYYCCDTLCEGYNIDYYANGNKRIEGSFKNGEPYGDLIFYKPDGTEDYVKRYTRKRNKFTIGKYRNGKPFGAIITYGNDGSVILIKKYTDNGEFIEKVRVKKPK